MTNGEMQRMRKAGFTYREISEKSGIPETTIASRCQRWGIKPARVIRYRDRTSYIKNDYPRWLINELYWECELSTNEIAYELDIPSQSVHTMMLRLGIPLRTKLEAAEVRQRRGRMAIRSLTHEEALRLAQLSIEARRRKTNGSGNRQQQV